MTSRAQFDHFFRKYPDYGNHQAGYCIAAGLEWLVEWMQTTRVTGEDLDALRSITGVTGSLFSVTISSPGSATRETSSR